MSVFINRLRNRVSQATYRPRRSASYLRGADDDSPKYKPRTLSEHLEGLFLEEVKEAKEAKKEDGEKE